MSAKPYATSFTFDPNEDRIYCPLSATEQIIIAGIPDSLRNNERRRATAQLLADAPGALVECHAALAGLFALGDSEIERPLTLRKGWPKFIVQANSAILRAEKVLGLEKGKP